ncbi:flavin reductase family protein [Amycolatopsis sp. NPDC051071]|uniref:flavin reductase family protein n=1 Tax=Amycolatopsis sp. NPDC051071 TaxID=3154637 RepID=UPI0034186175
MPVAAEDFTRTLTRVPAPVTVVTTVDHTGRRRGFTGSAFSSLSLDPPLILMCLGKTASTHSAFVHSGHFLVNVLAQHQDEIARRFAESGVDRFLAGDTTTAELGLPGIPGAAARIGCTTHAVHDGGDHSILIGRVEVVYAGTAEPLVYCDRGFARLTTA